MLPLAAFLSAIAGFLLGLLGGGGSILIVPILAYVVQLDAHAAVGTSLVIVGATSAVAAGLHARAGRVKPAVGIPFGLAGMLGAYAGAFASAWVSSTVLLLCFGALMLVTAVAMFRKRPAPSAADAPVPEANTPTLSLAPVALLRVAVIGFFVGGLTGFVGAGGGFIIVPALTLLAGLDVRVAVGTSLLVITMQAFAGVLAHHDIPLDTAGILTASTIVGSLVGVRAGHSIKPDKLRRMFAMFVLVMAFAVLGKEIWSLTHHP